MFKMMMWYVLAVVAMTAVCVWGYPTAKELEAAQPLLNELMAPAMRGGKPAEAAASAVEFAKDAETEAAKYLLLRGAVDLYARAGDDAKAAETFTALLGAVKDVPFNEQERILLSAGRALSKSENSEQIQALYREVKMRIGAERELKAAEDILAKSPRSAVARLRAGNACAVLGDWPKALKYLSGVADEIAKLAREDAGGEAPAEKLADGWWKAADEVKSADVKAAYRVRAAAHYRKALAGGSLSGLRKTLAERRVEESERTGQMGQSEMAGMPQLAAGKRLGQNALYCEVDLSAGQGVKHYPVKYLAAEPSGWSKEKGWPDEYKTTKLVLRRIEAGAYIMGNDQSDESHRVTLTKPFYIGVFEVTQKQYQLVMGSNPSKFSGDKRPVEQVSYNMIRGASSGAKWPLSSEVDSSSFLGKLRARTGLEFDLPTEAQWEYASRAGAMTIYSYGNSADGDYMWYNSNSSRSSHDVGSKNPNPWGVYDMHGNVYEWCLDWSGMLAYGTDPKGASSGTDRVFRGGSWFSSARYCGLSYRHSIPPSNGFGDYGFRLVSPLSK